MLERYTGGENHEISKITLISPAKKLNEVELLGILALESLFSRLYREFPLP